MGLMCDNYYCRQFKAGGSKATKLVAYRDFKARPLCEMHTAKALASYSGEATVVGTVEDAEDTEAELWA